MAVAGTGCKKAGAVTVVAEIGDNIAEEIIVTGDDDIVVEANELDDKRVLTENSNEMIRLVLTLL